MVALASFIFFFQIKTQQATVWISWTSAGTNTMMELCQLNLPCWRPWSLWDPKLLHHVQRTEAFRRRSGRAAARRAWSALPSGEITTVKKLATDQFDYRHEHLNSEGGSNTTDLPYLCRFRLGCLVNEKKCCIQRLNWFITSKSFSGRWSYHKVILPHQN